MATQKELFVRIAEAMSQDAEVVEFCNKKIEQIENRKSTPRKSTPRKPSAETVAMRAAILTYLSENTDPVTAAIVGEAMGISSRQASGMLTYLVKMDQAIAIEPEKKGTAKTYVIA